MGKDSIPTFDKLFNPTLTALHKLGGSASIQELVDEIVSDLGLSEEVAEIPHGNGTDTEVAYRAAWARTYLKSFGLIENSSRGIWALTTRGSKTQRVDPKQVVKEVRDSQKKVRRTQENSVELAVPPEVSPWQDDLLEVLRKMDPTAFERLCQRLLRESGFIEVEVTKQSGDGGIDGFGTIRLGGLISFNVLFQCKRYTSNIGPDTVRDFRGAMVGRADKGLLITTGGFTREARKEATRDGAPPIDLIDGALLVEKLKEFRLGVKVEMVEEVEINKEWFQGI